MTKKYKENAPISARKFMDELKRYKKVPFRGVNS